MPKPAQMLSKVATEGVVLRLKIFATVDCDRPDAMASRYSLYLRSDINSRMRAFASICLTSWTIFYVSVEL